MFSGVMPARPRPVPPAPVRPGDAVQAPLPFRAELGRKALHLLALVVPAALVALGPPWAVGLSVPLALVALGADALRARSVGFSGFVGRWFGWMMRAEERPPVPGPVAVNGATWVLVTAALLALLFPLGLGMTAFAAFMLADAAAALVGRRFGRHPWPRTTRTVEGSAAFVGVALVVLLVLPAVAPVPGVRPLVAGLAALAMAAAEAAPLPVNDNLRAPLVGAALLWALG